MSLRVKLLCCLGLLCAAGLAPVRADEPVKKAAQPQVEVVFCLDTTGSMKGLIHAAKQKIWSICNQATTGTPTPHVKVGLVAYRDRGDAYITKVFDLTDDLDGIYANLMGLQAAGGGDFPESVNQALYESVTKVSWSTDKKTLRMIFLVGDAPPHMDYANDVKYPETCQLAVKNDIIINTVQCGKHKETQKYWQDICRLAEGSYVQIGAQGGPVVAMETPFDADLAKLNGELAKRTLSFGTVAAQAAGAEKSKAGADLAPAAQADRVGFLIRNSAGGTSYDLLYNVQTGKVKLESLKKEELPAELRDLTLEQQKDYLDKLDGERKELTQKALELDKKRNDFVAKKQAEIQKTPAANSFDGQVLRILQQQAGRNNLMRYATDDQKKKD
jgi:Mg-chelatase subunit ChlD